MTIITRNTKIRRALRTRSKIKSAKARPRLSVFRSNKYVYGQIIDDAKAITLVSISSAVKKGDKITKSEAAKQAGRELAKKSIEKGIKEVIFDRGRFKYHGRVKIFADSSRENGLTF